jgi:hypothetical protein
MTGTLQGDKTVDYKLRASPGQSMRVKLATNNASSYFNVLPPGPSDEAIFVGSSDGNEWSGVLLGNGEYTIRVYLGRSAALRDEKADFSLDVAMKGRPRPSPALLRAFTSDAWVQGERVASGNEKVSATKAGDTRTIDVNDYQHYRVYDSVIFGG